MPIPSTPGWAAASRPTERLQEPWCGDPCAGREPRWYDPVFTTVYATHFLAGLTIAAVLWVRSRDEWMLWMRRYLGISFGALVVYIVYPMAPPWMASERAAGRRHRITPRGWSDIGLDRVDLILHGVGNPVAAMPSLHAGITFLVAPYGIQRLRSPWRWLLVLYPLAMCTALVYFAEHYVIDVSPGIAGRGGAGRLPVVGERPGPGADRPGSSYLIYETSQNSALLCEIMARWSFAPDQRTRPCPSQPAAAPRRSSPPPVSPLSRPA